MGLKKINNQVYLDLSNDVDLSHFDKIQPQIIKGLSIAKEYAQIGNLDIMPEWLELDDNISYTPLIMAYEEYKKLPITDPIKISAEKLTIDQLATYLKFMYGGYDLYITYHKHLFPTFFPELEKWINEIEIFDAVTNSFIMTMEAGGISFDHKHPPFDENDPSKPSEFIHIRPNLDRPFYVRDPITLEKFIIDTRVSYWNDQDRHGGDPVLKPTYSIRIEGKFTKKFKDKIYESNS